MNPRFFLVVVILAIAAVPLNAGPGVVPGLCGTGYSSGCGSLLSGGQTDGNYTYTYTYPGPGSTTGSAVVLSAANTLTTANNAGYPGWYFDPSNALWVSTADGTYPFGGGKDPGMNATVNYAISFNLTGFDLSRVVISGSWTADDEAPGLILNGTSLSANSPSQGGALPNTNYSPTLPYTQTYSFSLSSSTPGVTFNAGWNTLVFSVRQDDNYYDGLLVDSLYGTLQGSGVPEPGSILLIAAGLGMLALRRRRA